jgi:hypothetical protein
MSARSRKRRTSGGIPTSRSSTPPMRRILAHPADTGPGQGRPRELTGRKVLLLLPALEAWKAGDDRAGSGIKAMETNRHCCCQDRGRHTQGEPQPA